MSLANLGEIKTAVQARGYATDVSTEIVEFTNAIYRDVLLERRWSWREASGTVSAVVGNPVVDTSALTLLDGRPDAVRIEIGSIYVCDLDYLEPEEFRAKEQVDRTNSQPIYWTYFAGQLKLYPRPDQAYTVTVDYFKKYTALDNDGDVPLIPEEHRDVLVYGDLEELALRERDETAASYWSAKKERSLGRLRAADARSPRQTPGQVKRSGFYDGYC